MCENQSKEQVESIIKNLMASYEGSAALAEFVHSYHINRSTIIKTIELMRELIFPYYFGKKNILDCFFEYHIGELLEQLIFLLRPEIGNALRHRKDAPAVCVKQIKEEAEKITNQFLSKLGDVRKLLLTGVDATFDGDPAADSRDEIISSYPGIYAIMVYRLSNVLYNLNVPLIPRIMTEHAHSSTGIDINPGAEIGHHFFIDHGTGIVIGETTVIVNHVKIYQGVTLGGLSTRGGQSLRNKKRHPTIEDNVTIYSGASIFGGETVIGKGTVIGSNAFVTKSVPANSRVSIKSVESRQKEIESAEPQTEYKEIEQEEFWYYQI